MSQLCTVCGAPRKTASPACPFCHTLFEGEKAAALPGTDAEVLAALDRNSLIDAMKLYRQLHGCGLKEAKKAVEAIAAQRRR